MEAQAKQQEAHEDIRGIVRDNTEGLDLNFPTLEFRRRREFKDADYYQKDFRPAPYPVSQSEGAVWSAMAREKRRGVHLVLLSHGSQLGLSTHPR